MDSAILKFWKTLNAEGVKPPLCLRRSPSGLSIKLLTARQERTQILRLSEGQRVKVPPGALIMFSKGGNFESLWE
jgi:hypothetical protein